MKNKKKLDELLKGRHPLIFIPTVEESYVLRLVRDAGIERMPAVWLWSAVGGLRNGMLENADAEANTMNAGAALTKWMGMKKPGLLIMLDVAAHLGDALILRALRDAITKAEEEGLHLVLVDHADQLPPVIAGAAVRFEPMLPDDDELEQIMVRELKKVHRATPVKIETDKEGIRAVARAMRGLTRAQAARLANETVADDQVFNLQDIEKVLDAKRRLLGAGSALESVLAPASLDDVGGLVKLKAWLKKREPAFSNEKAAEFGLAPPRGVLILGVQGAGKSLCAKAIASAWQRPLLRLDPGSLYDRYVGESERRLRDALKQAEAMAPVVLWIDEIEKGFASAASRSVDGGLSQRMFGTLLTWMQDHRAPVFLTATANDIEALPPELLRKGRFDEIFFVDLPSRETRRLIFEIHLKKRGRVVKDFDLDALTDATEGYSGAEMEQAVEGGMYAAFAERKPLATAHVLEAARNSPPLSVTMAEKIASLRAWARDRCVAAD